MTAEQRNYADLTLRRLRETIAEGMNRITNASSPGGTHVIFDPNSVAVICAETGTWTRNLSKAYGVSPRFDNSVILKEGNTVVPFAVAREALMRVMEAEFDHMNSLLD